MWVCTPTLVLVDVFGVVKAYRRPNVIVFFVEALIFPNNTKGHQNKIASKTKQIQASMLTSDDCFVDDGDGLVDSGTFLRF